MDLASTSKRRVIVDFDVGSDDALALMVLLHAEKIGSIKIEALICSHGNTERDNVVKNTVRLLELAGRTDIPVYKGCLGPLIPLRHPVDRFHGQDGFGDLKHDKDPDLSVVQQGSGIVALRKFIEKYPKEITLLYTGTLTNLALAMKTYDKFAKNIKEIFIMGGNYTALGNITSTAEFNFYMDPEAVHVVLESAKCPVTLLTWEVCTTSTITMDWRFKVLAPIKSPFMDLLTKAEKVIYKDYGPTEPYLPCDAYLAAVALYPNLIQKKIKHHATVELHGSDTRGQVVVDHLKKHKPNVVIVDKLDYDEMKKVLIEAAKSLTKK